jgi:hypothetical protein
MPTQPSISPQPLPSAYKRSLKDFTQVAETKNGLKAHQKNSSALYQ